MCLLQVKELHKSVTIFWSACYPGAHVHTILEIFLCEDGFGSGFTCYEVLHLFDLSDFCVRLQINVLFVSKTRDQFDVFYSEF